MDNNCIECAFNNDQIPRNACDMFNNKPKKCWAGCYTEEELKKRYDAILFKNGNFSKTELKEYTKYQGRLIRRKKSE